MTSFKPEKRLCKYKKCKEGPGGTRKEFIAIRHWHFYCDDPCRVKDWREKHPNLSPKELKEIKEKLGMT